MWCFVPFTDLWGPLASTWDAANLYQNPSEGTSGQLQTDLLKLLKVSIQPPTQTQYLKHWNNFCAFLTNDLHLAYTATITPQHVALFITSLHQWPLAYKTIRTYITALSFVLKLKFDTDATVSPLVARTLSGVKASSSPRAQTRPITKKLLHKLLDAIPLCTYAAYLRSLYKALFLVTYYACLRPGEVVLSTNPKHVLNIEQVSWDKQLSYFELSFSSFKHSQQRTPTIKIQKTSDSAYCPVQSFHDFCRLRGNASGPIFIHTDRKPATRNDFTRFLTLCLEACNEDPQAFGTHSFRIGRATQLAEDSATDDQIKRTSRWHSNAFQDYIRINKFTPPQ